MAATYVEIVSHYRREIETGTLKQGERLPPVREIADRWGVAKATVDRAVAQLRAEGLVRTGKGSIGTIVDVKDRRQDVIVTIGGLGRDVRVVSTKVITATGQTADDLGVPPESAVVVMKLSVAD